jgi:hypothetical protein
VALVVHRSASTASKHCPDPRACRRKETLGFASLTFCRRALTTGKEFIEQIMSFLMQDDKHVFLWVRFAG